MTAHLSISQLSWRFADDDVADYRFIAETCRQRRNSGPIRSPQGMETVLMNSNIWAVVADEDGSSNAHHDGAGNAVRPEEVGIPAFVRE